MGSHCVPSCFTAVGNGRLKVTISRTTLRTRSKIRRLCLRGSHRVRGEYRCATAVCVFDSSSCRPADLWKNTCLVALDIHRRLALDFLACKLSIGVPPLT